MSITSTLLVIGTTDITNLVDYEVQYNKLWKDADRNMEGEVRASLIGIFPKIICKTTTITQSKVATLGGLLNTPYFSVTFYDPITNGAKTANYYASDYSAKLRERERELFYEIAFSLVPVGKRS